MQNRLPSEHPPKYKVIIEGVFGGVFGILLIMIEYMFDHLSLETMGKHLIMIIYTFAEVL